MDSPNSPPLKWRRLPAASWPTCTAPLIVPVMAAASIARAP
ncbi:hypothetical protein [Nocardia abscessus]|nr:hypothetical protein [Nocardia abscessus]